MVLMSATVHALNDAIPVAVYEEQEINEDQVEQKRKDFKNKFLSENDSYEEDQFEVMLTIKKCK